MPFLHKQLSEGGWYELSICEQMANIGSEVERAISWRKKDDSEYSKLAFYRALDLIALTKQDKRWVAQKRLGEICRLYEVLCDYFAGENKYKTTDESLQKYFYQFNFAARKNK